MTSKNVVALALLPLILAACGGSKSDAAATNSKGPDQAAAPAAHAEAPGTIILSTDQQKAAQIDTAEAGPAQVRETLPLYGVVAPNAVRMREVAARFPGVIRNVNKNIGDAVRQGDVLATVESNESLQTYPVTAPLAGIVTARNANPGEQTGEKQLFTVADLSTVWVELSLFPRDVAKVRVGQNVRVKSPDTGGASDGKVVYVAPFGEAANQTLTARVLLDNAERRWAPGLYVTAEVTLAEAQVPLAIRNEAIQNLDGRDVVFVQTDKGFETHPVQIGRKDSEFSEVTDGLAAGQRYATRNSYILKADLGKGSAEE